MIPAPTSVLSNSLGSRSGGGVVPGFMFNMFDEGRNKLFDHERLPFPVTTKGTWAE